MYECFAVVVMFLNQGTSWLPHWLRTLELYATSIARLERDALVIARLSVSTTGLNTASASTDDVALVDRIGVIPIWVISIAIELIQKVFAYSRLRLNPLSQD